MVVTGVVHGTSFLLTYYASLLSKEGQGLGELLNEIKVPRFFYTPKLRVLRLAARFSGKSGLLLLLIVAIA